MSEDLEKTIRLVQKMIERKDKLTDIYLHESEYYFKYNDKYSWSVARSVRNTGSNTVRYVLYLYPDWTGSSSDLAHTFAAGAVDEVKLAAFTELSNSDQGQRLLSQLQRILRNRNLNVDAIVDDILNDD